jgi:hypothetical protein
VLSWNYDAPGKDAEDMVEEQNQTNRASMMKRVTFLLIGLIISIEGEKFAQKYLTKTIQIVSEEFSFQAEKLKQLYTVNPVQEAQDAEEEEQIEIVKKEMGELSIFGITDEKDTHSKHKRRKLQEEVSKEE